MTTLIFLDDERHPKDVTWMGIDYSRFNDVYIVRTFEEFCDLLSTGITLWEDVVVSFDHDLQDFYEDGTEKTGYDCLKHLVDFSFAHELKIPQCYFHTQNTVGQKNMRLCYLNTLKFQMETEISLVNN